jgi:SAM-dependent methyltransferase
LTTLLDVPTTAFLCASCGHGQSDNLPDVHKFYDTEYRISLESDEHDQLYAVAEGTPVYRTDRQAELVVEFVDIPKGALLLDYGAAKAATLKKVLAMRPDVVGHVFDVSMDYVSSWESWLSADRRATYSLPDSWKQIFDVATAHFVLEHVESPVEVLRSIHSVLKPNGVLLLSVPDVLANPGDLLVVDHLNHFSISSVERALVGAGFGDIKIDRAAFTSALVVTARKKATGTASLQTSVVLEPMLEVAKFWSRAGVLLDHIAARRGKQKCAIYGAGFYGSFIAARIGSVANLVCFVDRNAHLQGKAQFGFPIVPPERLPHDVTLVYAGVNPSKAHTILKHVPEWEGRKIERIFMDELE